MKAMPIKTYSKERAEAVETDLKIERWSHILSQICRNFLLSYYTLIPYIYMENVMNLLLFNCIFTCLF